MLKSKKNPEFKYELGSRAKDKITGFEGIIMCRAQWLNNCNVYGIKPTKLRDDKPIEMSHFDEPEIEIIEEKVVKPERTTGGPAQAIPHPNR